jgi:PPOX class probable F420-dependent enzyme
MDTGSDILQPWERDFVAAQRVARLATISRDGRPHLVPVCFALDGGSVFIAVDEKPKRAGTLARVANIQRDPRATLLFDHYSDHWEQLAWVRLDCVATVHERGGGHPAVLELLRSKYAQYSAMALEGLPLIELAVERAVSWRWRG